jgi:hypothetical protein
MQFRNMFAWLTRLFRGPERCLFHYWDGQRRRAADPAAAWRKLWTHDVNFANTITVARDPIKADGLPFYSREQVYEAENDLWQLIRDVFDVKAWSEDSPGLTINETDELLARFMDFIAELKKKVKPSPMPSVPLESTEPPPSSDTVNSPLGADADYCSTPNASNADAPTGP